MSLQLSELQARITRLKALVDDPQPGLISWCQCLHEEMTALTSGWLSPKTSGYVDHITGDPLDTDPKNLRIVEVDRNLAKDRACDEGHR